ncbi:MAG: hypothetical protein MZV70_37790 [Desulfobacterales bacterium]|nr:hypothetical protein [Desulfobacterales bacterium]
MNEVEIRRYEMLVHNLQSSFDTYVIHGGFRFGNRKLKQLRGFFSVVFHLLQMVGRLLHFYERHLHEAGYKNTYKKRPGPAGGAGRTRRSFSTAPSTTAFTMSAISWRWAKSTPG